MALPRVAFRPNRTCQFDSPNGAALVQWAFRFEKARGFPTNHPNVDIRGLFPDYRRDYTTDAADIDFDGIAHGL